MKKLNTVLSQVAINGVVCYPFIETETIRNTPVTRLTLDTRSSNALQRNHVKTIGELLDKIPELDKIRGLGEKSKSRIMYELCAFTYASLDNKRKKDYLMKIIKLNTERR